MNTINIRLYDIARHKLNLAESDAKDFVEALNASIETEMKSEKEGSVTKSDIAGLRIEMKDMELRIQRQAYWINIVQFLAIVGTMMAIVKFMVTK